MTECFNARVFFKAFLSVFCCFYSGSGTAQAINSLCLNSTISVESNVHSISTIRDVQLTFSLTNCGLPLDLVTSPRTGYEDDDLKNLYFSIFRCIDSSCIPYDYERADIGPPFSNDKWSLVKTGESIYLNISVFKLYGILDKGDLRIQGFYRVRKKGFYIVVPTNTIQISVH